MRATPRIYPGRESDIAECQWLLKWHTALIEMNIQLSNVGSDLSGVSGMAIIQAIMAEQRDPRKLAALADPQLKASKAVIAKSLHGN